MLWISTIGGIILAVIVIVVIIDIVLFEDPRDQLQIRDYGITLLFCAVVSVGSALGCYKINSMGYEEKVKTNDWELVALSGISSTDGIMSDVIYLTFDKDGFSTFAYKENDEKTELKRISVEDMEFSQRDWCTAHVVEYEITTKKPIFKPLLWLLTFNTGEETRKFYEICVPTKIMVESTQL